MAQSALLSRETSASSDDIRLDKSARFIGNLRSEIGLQKRKLILFRI
jgi:hypothetical protein